MFVLGIAGYFLQIQVEMPRRGGLPRFCKPIADASVICPAPPGGVKRIIFNSDTLCPTA